MEHAAPEPESAAALLKTRLEETQQELQRLQQQLEDNQQQEKDEDPQKPPWVLHICGNPKAEWWLNKMVEMHGKPPDVVYVHQLIREWHEYGGKDKKRKAAQGEMTGEVAQVVGGGELIGEGQNQLEQATTADQREQQREQSRGGEWLLCTKTYDQWLRQTHKRPSSEPPPMSRSFSTQQEQQQEQEQQQGRGLP